MLYTQSGVYVPLSVQGSDGGTGTAHAVLQPRSFAHISVSGVH